MFKCGCGGCSPKQPESAKEEGTPRGRRPQDQRPSCPGRTSRERRRCARLSPGEPQRKLERAQPRSVSSRFTTCVRRPWWVPPRPGAWGPEEWEAFSFVSLRPLPVCCLLRCAHSQASAAGLPCRVTVTFLSLPSPDGQAVEHRAPILKGFQLCGASSQHPPPAPSPPGAMILEFCKIDSSLPLLSPPIKINS